MIRNLKTLLIAVVAVILIAPQAWAFCGFYVAKADTKLYNKASQVAIARDGNRTVLTMANDFQGDVKDFAVVVPVPTVLKQDQVQVGEPKIMERLDAFSAPRLVEYFDEDPCAANFQEERVLQSAAPASQSRAEADSSALGVTVEAKFTVGEYDIVVLSAKESNGLETWLRRNSYQLPQGARSLLQPYIRQQMKFFVAKVNLAEFEKSGYQFLRPLMMAYESPKFMLPIRLGMLNAVSEQDLIVYLLSPKGQTEVTNYRTVKVASDVELPVYIKNEFSNFYRSLFQTAYSRESKKAVFLEYAWNMAGCDPCSADPLTPEELRQAGVFWLTSSEATNVYITRLHVRYTRDKFPEDLMFKETPNQQQFQGRYVLRHPFKGDSKCQAAQQYQKSLGRRLEQEAQTLARLTGWNIQDIRRQIPTASGPLPWWKTLWSK